jgi:hypothetical protein
VTVCTSNNLPDSSAGGQHSTDTLLAKNTIGRAKHAVQKIKHPQTSIPNRPKSGAHAAPVLRVSRSFQAYSSRQASRLHTATQKGTASTGNPFAQLVPCVPPRPCRADRLRRQMHSANGKVSQHTLPWPTVTIEHSQPFAQHCHVLFTHQQNSRHTISMHDCNRRCRRQPPRTATSMACWPNPQTGPISKH